MLDFYTNRPIYTKPASGWLAASGESCVVPRKNSLKRSLKNNYASAMRGHGSKDRAYLSSVSGNACSTPARDSAQRTLSYWSRSACVGHTLNLSMAGFAIIHVFAVKIPHPLARSSQSCNRQKSRNAARTSCSVVSRCWPSMICRRSTCVVGVAFWSRAMAPKKWTGASVRPSRFSMNFRDKSSHSAPVGALGSKRTIAATTGLLSAPFSQKWPGLAQHSHSQPYPRAKERFFQSNPFKSFC